MMEESEWLSYVEMFQSSVLCWRYRVQIFFFNNYFTYPLFTMFTSIRAVELCLSGHPAPCSFNTLLCIPPPPPTTCIITTMHSEATRTDVKLFFSKLLLRPRRGGLLQFWHRPSSSGDYSLLKAILQTIINGHLNKVSPQMVWLAEIPKVPEDKYPNLT